VTYPVQQTDPTKVFGRRVAAVIIDILIIFVPTFLVASAQFEYIEVENLGVSGDVFCDRYLDENGGACVDLTDVNDRVYFTDDTGGASNALGFALNFGLLVLLQAFTGWTPGKLLTGIRTVREDGQAPGFVKAFLRWLLWIVDGFPYFIPGLTGFIVGLTTVGHRRVGDMVAKTFVVRASATGSPIVVPGLTTGAAAAATAGWGGPPPATPAGPGSWGAAPPAEPAAPTGWGGASDPASPGWASPTPPVAPPQPAATPPPGSGPQWDEARGTYIQWDPAASAWMQWDEASKAWVRMPGQ
jgi:uncharacterized RDD family membrane protein YckC